MKLVIGLSGGSGIVYGVRFLEVLRELGVESHLVFTVAAKKTLVLETDYTVNQVESLATKVYGTGDIAAPPSSGSFKTDGMVVIPCSMKTLAGIASGYSDNLLLRAADVTLKERRPLILVLRETPLNIIHIQNMLRAAQAGAVIAPAMPAFYHRPKTIEDLLNHQIGKVLDLLGVEHNLFERWKGAKQ